MQSKDHTYPTSQYSNIVSTNMLHDSFVNSSMPFQTTYQSQYACQIVSENASRLRQGHTRRDRLQKLQKEDSSQYALARAIGTSSFAVVEVPNNMMQDQ